MKYILPALKSYGDFIILLNCLKYFRCDYKIIAGNHLLKLGSLVCDNENIEYINFHKNNNIPSIYNVKKDGFLEATKSLFFLICVLRIRGKGVTLIH